MRFDRLASGFPELWIVDDLEAAIGEEHFPGLLLLGCYTEAWGSPMIFLRRGPGVRATVLLHELGHWAISVLTGLGAIGGPHFWYDRILRRLAGKCP